MRVYVLYANNILLLETVLGLDGIKYYFKSTELFNFENVITKSDEQVLFLLFHDNT